MGKLHPVHDFDLGLRRGVTQGKSQEESIPLRLREQERSLMLQRVLRREHPERPWQGVRHAIDGHLTFLHRLQQRGLRFWRAAVDLIRQDKMSKDRPSTELEFAGPLVVQIDADYFLTGANQG